MSFELIWWFICVYVCLLWLGLVHCSASYNICLYSIIQFFSTLGGLFPQQNSLSRLESCGHEGQMKIEMYIHYGRTMSRRRNICNCWTLVKRESTTLGLAMLSFDVISWFGFEEGLSWLSKYRLAAEYIGVDISTYILVLTYILVWTDCIELQNIGWLHLNVCIGWKGWTVWKGQRLLKILGLKYERVSNTDKIQTLVNV